jgi:hypothetical protein
MQKRALALPFHPENKAIPWVATDAQRRNSLIIGFFNFELLEKASGLVAWAFYTWVVVMMQRTLVWDCPPTGAF